MYHQWHRIQKEKYESILQHAQYTTDEDYREEVNSEKRQSLMPQLKREKVFEIVREVLGFIEDN